MPDVEQWMVARVTENTIRRDVIQRDKVFTPEAYGRLLGGRRFSETGLNWR